MVRFPLERGAMGKSGRREGDDVVLSLSEANGKSVEGRIRCRYSWASRCLAVVLASSSYTSPAFSCLGRHLRAGTCCDTCLVGNAEVPFSLSMSFLPHEFDLLFPLSNALSFRRRK